MLHFWLLRQATLRVETFNPAQKQVSTALHHSGAASLFRSFLPYRTALAPRAFLRRWIRFSWASFAAFVLLDRTTVHWHMWHGISAWYPPTGLAFALFVGIGATALPTTVLGDYVATTTSALPFLHGPVLFLPVNIGGPPSIGCRRRGRPR